MARRHCLLNSGGFEGYLLYDVMQHSRLLRLWLTLLRHKEIDQTVWIPPSIGCNNGIVDIYIAVCISDLQAYPIDAMGVPRLTHSLTITIIVVAVLVKIPLISIWSLSINCNTCKISSFTAINQDTGFTTNNLYF